jgi:hypothetical protein
LGGDKLVDGAYQPIPIQRIEAETHRATVRRSTCTCAGRKANWVGTTPPPDDTSSGTKTSETVPTTNGLAVWTPSPAPTPNGQPA